MAQFAHRSEGTLRGAARTENDRLLGPRQPGFLQSRDHAGDVSVVRLPASGRAGCREHQRVRGPDGQGQRRYLVGDGQRHPLERHRQRQADPLGSHAVDQARQVWLIALDLVVVPAMQVKRQVGRSVQHGGERVLDRGPEHGRSSYFLAYRGGGNVHVHLPISRSAPARPAGPAGWLGPGPRIGMSR